MVNEITGWDRADVVFIGPTRGSDPAPTPIRTAANPKATVSVAVKIEKPRPAPVGFRSPRVGAKTNFIGDVFNGHISPPMTLYPK